jgi:hypothetical protein
MKRFSLVFGAAFLLAIGLNVATANAALTLTFDPDALIQSAPASAGTSDTLGQNKVSQENARRVHQPWGTVYETFYNPANPQPQPDSYNTYMNWRDSLGAGEGIAMFNSWFLDDSIVRTWGETIVIKPGTAVTGTAASGWNVRVIDSPYGLGGSSVQWWTTDPTKRINTVSAIGNFSITADLYWDANGNGWDPGDAPVVSSDGVRFWAGCINGDDPEFYRGDTQALYFDDQGWGTRPSSVSPFSAIYASGANNPLGSGFEAAITPVPEPATLLVWSLLGAMSWLGMRVWRGGQRISRRSWSPENRQAILEIIDRRAH